MESRSKYHKEQTTMVMERRVEKRTGVLGEYEIPEYEKLVGRDEDRRQGRHHKTGINAETAAAEEERGRDETRETTIRRTMKVR